MTTPIQAEPAGRIGHEAGTFDPDVPSPGEGSYQPLRQQRSRAQAVALPSP